MLLPYLTLSKPILHRHQYYYHFTDEELDVSKLNGLTRLRMLINGRYRATPKSVQQVFEKCCFLQCHSLITLMRHTHTKKMIFTGGTCLCGVCPILPVSACFCFFPPEGGSTFLPHPKDGHLRRTGVSTVFQSE